MNRDSAHLPPPAVPLTFRPYAATDAMNDWGSTNRVSAEVGLAEGVALEGDLHLLTRFAYPPGPETPLEMLNRSEAFFALTLPDGGVAFVPKAQVAVVTCRDQAGLADPDRVSAAKLVELEVVLRGGKEYRGRATAELHPSRARALDYVNSPGGFFAIWGDEVTWYINKSLVRYIRPLD
ncbi:MAG: hypothetical protein H0T90_00340 [Gemmatimonadales bacterium]|nr:hypothetical protein [Gemmatimonadales bacterium]